MDQEHSSIVDVFGATARAVGAAVAGIPDDAWEAPGLGTWTLRDLVGHTSRALVTVVDYLARPVPHEAVPSAAAYFTAVSTAAGVPGGVDADAVTERGRQAGRALGPEPAVRFAQLVDEAVAVARATDPGLVVHTIAGGMRVAAYLPTRTFELCVHGLDIASAADVPLDLPEHALEECCALAAVSAAQRGHGPSVLQALTGRSGLPPGFSVV